MFGAIKIGERKEAETIGGEERPPNDARHIGFYGDCTAISMERIQRI